MSTAVAVGVLALASSYPIAAMVRGGSWDTGLPDPRGDFVNSETALYDVTLTAPADWSLATTGVGATASTTAGTSVKVETVPWPNFQTKAFTEFNAKGDAYDMVVGDSQWLGAGSTNGHYVELTDFFKKHNVDKVMAPATVAGYAEYPPKNKKYWAIPLEGDANDYVGKGLSVATLGAGLSD